jgi:hypothetical protein
MARPPAGLFHTAGSAHLEGIDFGGKTGTAQVMSHEGWTKHQGRRTKSQRLVCGHVTPRRNPELVVPCSGRTATSATTRRASAPRWFRLTWNKQRRWRTTWCSQASRQAGGDGRRLVRPRVPAPAGIRRRARSRLQAADSLQIHAIGRSGWQKFHGRALGCIPPPFLRPAIPARKRVWQSAASPTGSVSDWLSQPCRCAGKGHSPDAPLPELPRLRLGAAGHGAAALHHLGA